MDLNAIRQKLQSMQNQGNGQANNNNRPNYFWKPSEGNSKVRILPSAFNAASPFSEMKMYYEDELQRALTEDGQRTSVHLVPQNYFPGGS